MQLSYDNFSALNEPICIEVWLERPDDIGEDILILKGEDGEPSQCAPMP